MRWLIILLEFDFIVVVKKGTTHQKIDHLRCLTHGEAPTRVEDDLPDAYLLNIKMIPKGSEDYVPLLTIGQMDIHVPLREKQALIQMTTPFVMLVGRMYHTRHDKIL